MFDPPPSDPAKAVARSTVVCRDEDQVPESLRGAVVGIGNFDGVHLGHRHLIDRVRRVAEREGRPAAVLTFEPHPRTFFAPDAPLFRLTPEPIKLQLLGRLGLDAVFLRRFDGALAGTSARGFIDDLAARFSGVVVGHDFHFGKGREGTPTMLAELCRERRLSCTLVRAVEDEGQVISSSLIRTALEAGEIRHANALLGYRWFVEGEVRHGDKRGRDLGFPTANLALGPNCRLRHGIYAVRIALGPGDVRKGVASFGRRPTFDNGQPLLEVNLFDFSGDLYGRRIEVEFAGWIRAEERFDSVEALVRQMGEDAALARTLLARETGTPEPSMIG